MKKRAGIIIYNENTKKIMLIKRINNGTVCWIIPGGGVEKNETYKEAAKRECAEELNLNNLSFFQEKEFIHFIFDGIEHKYFLHITNLELEVKIVGEEINRITNDNQYILQWISIFEINHLNLKPDIIKGMLSKVIKEL